MLRQKQPFPLKILDSFLAAGGGNWAQGAHGVTVALIGWQPGITLFPVNYTKRKQLHENLGGH